MQNTIRWSLFGETINEQLNLEQLPKYITGDFKKDTEKYINLKKEDIEDEDFSISELVQDVYFVFSISEFENINDSKGYENSQELFTQIEETEIISNLFQSDLLNRLLMYNVKVKFYETKYNIDKIEEITEDTEEKEVIEKYFNNLNIILNNEVHDDLIYDFRDIHVKDECMQYLIERINEQNIENIENIRIRLIVEDWIRESDFTITKYELKRRLLRDFLRWRERIYFPYIYERIFHYYGDISLFLVRFIQDDGYMGIINTQLNIVNDIAFEVQKFICDPSVVKKKNFVKYELIKELKRELCNNEELEKYVIGKSCFALMKDRDTSKKSYFSISGLDNQKNTNFVNACEQVERALMKKNCLRIKLGGYIDKHMLYCTKNNNILSYDEYCKYKKYLQKNPDVGTFIGTPRMFSCCERKLFASLNSKSDCVIYVSKTSCYMCKKVSRYMHNQKKYKFHVTFGRHYKKMSKNKMNYYDKKAEKYIADIKKLPI